MTNWDELAEEANLGGEEQEETKPGKLPAPVYKLCNNNPKTGEAGSSNIKMITFKKNNERAKKGEKKKRFVPDVAELTPSVRAVILYSADRRVMYGKSGLECKSDDGESPSRRIANPACRVLDATGVATILSGFKGYDQARLVDTTKRLCQGSKQLQMCSIKLQSSFIPMCPKARWRELKDPQTGEVTNIKPMCEPTVSLICYDLDRERVFQIEMNKRSIQNNIKFKAPYFQFREFLADKKLLNAMYAVQVTIQPKDDNGFYHWDFVSPEPVSDAVLRLKLRELAAEEKEKDQKRISFEPTKKEDQDKGQLDIAAAAAAAVAEPFATTGDVPDESSIDFGTPAITGDALPESLKNDELPE